MSATRVLACTVCVSSAAWAGPTSSYVVSQFDPAEGDFVPLGSVVPYETELSASGFYGFSDGNPDLPPGSPEQVSERSHVFLVDSAVDGVALVYIHDRPNDGSGGHAEMQWMLAGDPNGAAWLVQDGPPGPSGDEYTGGPGDVDFTSSHQWPGINSDGAVLGSLNGCWSFEGAFTDVDGSPGDEMDGLETWIAYSASGATIAFVLETDRPIRIDRTTCCPWDLDGDGFVTVTDLVELIVNWGPNPDHPADFDGSGDVDVADLVALIINWGECDGG